MSDETVGRRHSPPPPQLRAVELSDNARTILARRYLVKDEEGRPSERPEDLYWRVAATIAETERSYGADAAEIAALAERFYDAMARGEFLPNSPTLMNAGRPLGQLSACFVLPVADALSNDRDGIYDTLRAMALVHQSGGGTGFSFSSIRPAGDRVRSTSGVASGPVSFMTLYDASTDVVKQGGTRRGANMAILRVDHPDVRTFVTSKRDLSRLTNFNVSVAMSDRFFDAVRSGGDYDLIHPATGEAVAKESAPAVYDEIVDHAWRTGEPGVFFIDRANEGNPVPHLGRYEATNPCGEQPLLPYDVCNLGSVNLRRFVTTDGARAEDPRDAVDWTRLAETVELAVRFLDDVVDANRYPLPEIADLARRIRRIGLGVMGWADMLIELGVRYDSERALDCADAVMGFVDETARRASERLAEERGPFPEWGRSVWGPDESCARTAAGERIRPERRVRNCNVTTVAPTGTISILAGCSSGIEPLFGVAFERRQADVVMHEVHPGFEMRGRGEGWLDDAVTGAVASSGSLDHPSIPDDVRELFVTAHRIAPEWHVRMQAAFQRHVDAAVSKTTNFPREATRDDVRKIFDLAFDLGCKGITVYRDGSRPEQVLSTGRTEGIADRPAPRVRPPVLTGRTVKMLSPLGDLYVTLNVDEQGEPFEVFCTLGKAGGAAMADTEAIGRLISLALRSGVPLERIVRQLRGISCDRAVGVGPAKVLSVPDAIAQALALHLEPGSVPPGERRASSPEADERLDTSLLGACPDCGAGQLAFEEGCANCRVCGYSECF